MTFRTILYRDDSPSIEVFVKASVSSYAEATGCAWLGNAVEVELLSVADHNNREIETSDDENAYLRSKAHELATR